MRGQRSNPWSGKLDLTEPCSSFQYNRGVFKPQRIYRGSLVPYLSNTIYLTLTTPLTPSPRHTHALDPTQWVTSVKSLTPTAIHSLQNPPEGYHARHRLTPNHRRRLQENAGSWQITFTVLVPFMQLNGHSTSQSKTYPGSSQGENPPEALVRDR